MCVIRGKKVWRVSMFSVCSAGEYVCSGMIDGFVDGISMVNATIGAGLSGIWVL